MKVKLEPRQIFEEYREGQMYNSSNGLYSNVEKNQRFFLGDQWAGVNAPDLTKPVFNIMKRVVSYFVAMICSDDVGVYITPFAETNENKTTAEIIAKQVEAVLERTKTKSKTRTNVKNACVDGDTCMYINFDPSIETGKTYMGDIDTEIIDNTHVIFGNPYSPDVQKQPYIIVAQRLHTAQVKDYAEEKGISEDERDKIKPDNDDYIQTGNIASNDKLTTVLTKFWKESTSVKKVDKFGVPYEEKITTVHYTKVANDVVLDKPVDLEYKLYPIAYFSWERVKNSYHGRSPITGLIPNQIFINKIYAMCMVYMTNMGFPRVFYDENKIAKLTNNVANATAITNMDMAGKVIDAVKAPDFSAQIIQLVDSTIAYTKDFMGASDAALGNVSNPNNTSAIVAVQQASSVPLEIQKLDFYQFFEDIVRSMVDIMSCRYGTREVRLTEEQAKALNMIETNPMTGMPLLDQYGQPVYKTTVTIDFSVLKTANYDVNVEIGQSSYWSEQTQVQTMDNLFDKGVITNPVTYLEGIPDKYIPNKAKIIDELKQQQAQAQMVQQMQAQMMAQPLPEEGADPSVTPRMQDGVDNRGSANPQLQEMYAESKEFYQ